MGATSDASERQFLPFNKIQALTTYLVSSEDVDTICEIAGGEARTTRVLIRMNDKRFTIGPNFDLVADIDLTGKREQLAFWDYRKQRKPKVCIMSPMCRSFGGLSRLNKVTNSGHMGAQLQNCRHASSSICNRSRSGTASG